MSEPQWKLAPLVPAEQMLDAVEGDSYTFATGDEEWIGCLSRGMAEEIYTNMLAATPQPPALGGEPESVVDLLNALALGEFDLEGGSPTVEAMSCKSLDDFGQDLDEDSYATGFQQAMYEHGVLLLGHVANLQAQLETASNFNREQGEDVARLQAEVERLKEVAHQQAEALRLIVVEHKPAVTTLRSMAKRAFNESRAALAEGKEHE